MRNDPTQILFNPFHLDLVDFAVVISNQSFRNDGVAPAFTVSVFILYGKPDRQHIVSHAECQQVRRDPEIIRCGFDRDLRQSLPTVDNLYALSALLDVRMDEILVAAKPELKIAEIEPQAEACGSIIFIVCFVGAVIELLVEFDDSIVNWRNTQNSRK